MFMFHPHVHGPDVVTTPDILIEHASRLGRTRPEVFGASDLSSAISVDARATDLFPSVVVIAGHPAPVLSVGFDGGRGRAIVGRQAWRLSDVKSQLDRLLFRIRRLSKTGELVSEHRLPGLPDTDPSRASAVFCSDDSLCVDATGVEWCEAEIFDPVLDRSILHRLWLNRPR